MPTWTQAARKLAIGVPSALGEDKLILQSFRLTEEISRPFCCELTLYSEDTEIDYNKIVGENVTIRLEQGNGKTRYINGYVSRFVQGGDEGTDSAHTYSATVVPWLWLLTRSSDCCIYQDKTVPEIVKEVFADFGCSELVEMNLTATYPKREYTVQYRETSFNFVSRLLEHEGIYYYFKHENGKHKLVLADSPSKHVVVEGYEKVPYHDGSSMESQGVTEWLLETRLMPGEMELLDFDFKVPAKDLKGTKILKGEHALADNPLFDFPGGYEEKDAGDTLAATRIEELMMHHSVARARGDARGLTVGCKFKLIGAPRTDHDGEYVITSMTCEATEDSFGRGNSNQMLFKNRFTCVKSTTQIRPRRVTPKPLITGPQTAIVTTSSDTEEILVDKFGRVKVHFHWDRYSPLNDTSSCWIRVAQLWAGKNWGAMFIPRKDQEVIVEFLDGDPDRPIITGRVYNGTNMPPYALPADKTKSTIKTNSSTGGEGFNELRFEDKKDSEQIFIHAQKNLDIRVRNNTAETTFGNREIRVGAEKDGNRSGNLNTFVQFDTNTLIKEGRYEKIEKTVNVTVVEDVVEDYQKNHTRTVAEKISINSRDILIETSEKMDLKSAATKVSGTDSLDLKGSATKIEGTQSIDVKTSALKMAGDSTLDAKGGTVNIEGAQTVNIKGGMNVNIEGSMGVSLKCGGNAIVLDPSGVAIQGTMVKINMGAAGQTAQSASAANAAEGAAAFEAAEIEEPLEASSAVNDRAGGKGGGRVAPRTRTKRTPGTQHAPPFLPPPPPPRRDEPPPPVPAQPPPPTSDKPCGIKCLDVQCGHKRKPGPSGVLQVVAEATVSSKITKEFGGIKVILERKTEGTDTGKGTVTVVDEAAAKRKQIALRAYDGSPPESAWQTGGTQDLEFKPPENDDYFPINPRPKTYYIHGRGCDELAHVTTVESYPSQQVSLTLEAEFFKKWAEAVNKGWKEWGASIMKLGPVKLEPKVTPPTGSLSASWGWKEDSDWQAFFEIAVTAGLDPIIGVGIELKLSIGTLILNGFGVPPPVADLAAEHLADIILAIGAEAKAALKGGPRARFYADGHERLVGELTLSGTGKFYAKITARIGSDYVASAALTAAGETTIEAEAKGEIERSGVYVTPKVTLKPLTVSVKVELKAFYIFSKERELKKWTPWEDVELYQGQKTKLLPGDDK